jgi:uncharacterized protein (TIGR03437 family)
MAVGSGDSLFIAELWSLPFRYFRVGSVGQISAVPGAAGFLGSALGLAADAAGNLYASDDNHPLSRLGPDGILNAIIPTHPSAAPEKPIGQDLVLDEGGPASQAMTGTIESLLVDAQDNLYLADSMTQTVRRISRVSECPSTARPQVSYLGVRNVSGGRAFAPGSIVSIYGARLGPENGVAGRIESARFTAELAGVRVLVDGVPAPLLYVSASQINAVIPYSIEVEGSLAGGVSNRHFFSARYARIQVQYEGVVSDPTKFLIQPAAPSLFMQGPQLAAALNEDGTLNGLLNPAAPGSVLVLFGTGQGPTDPPSVDGLIASPPLPKPIFPVEVTIGNDAA